MLPHNHTRTIDQTHNTCTHTHTHTQTYTHTCRFWWMGDPGPLAVLPTEKNAAATLAAQPTPFSGFVAVEQLQPPSQVMVDCVGC